MRIFIVLYCICCPYWTLRVMEYAEDSLVCGGMSPLTGNEDDEAHWEREDDEDKNDADVYDQDEDDEDDMVDEHVSGGWGRWWGPVLCIRPSPGQDVQQLHPYLIPSPSYCKNTRVRVFGMEEIMVYPRELVEFDRCLTMKWALIRK